MSYVTVNADDLGMNEHNTKAIAEAFAKGLVTDTTMLANGEYFHEAIVMAKEQGFFDKIGVHLNLTEGIPLTQDILSCPRFVTDGRFNKLYDRRKRLTDAEKEAIYKELSAQVKRIRDAGVTLTHADSHHHIHTGIFIAPIAERVCRENGIHKLRIHRNAGSIPFIKRLVKNSYNRRLVRQGFITTEYFAYVRDLGGGEIPDNTEIMVHPDFDKNGVLIDRSGVVDGCPAGDPLPDFREWKNVILRGYTEL